jgi:ParB family chromosome partitioning protein
MAKIPKMNLTFLDDIFTTQEVRDDAERERVRDIPLTSIDPYPEHPFRVQNDESMQAMVDSVRLLGIQNPALVRLKGDECYELISGHRRLMACKLAELETMPCIIRDMDDDEAAIALVDSNLQRERILPSERAKSYKLRLDALKRQAGRPGKDNSSQFGTNYRSDEALAKMTGDSRSQIRRYISLLNLIPQLLDMVDKGDIVISSAEPLIYLHGDEQSIVYDALEALPNKLDTKKAEALRAASPLDYRKVKSILTGEDEPKSIRPTTIKLKPDVMVKYFTPCTKPKAIMADIVEGLELLRAQRAQEGGES